MDGSLSFERILSTIERLIPAPPTPFANPYQALIFCVISLRTKDETTYPASARLFARAPDAGTVLSIGADAVAELIYPAGFYKRKAEQIVAMSRTLANKYEGEPPRTLEELLALPGVGLKTANFTLSRAYGIPAICVDVHVHRICNRMGLIQTDQPDKSEAALRRVMPGELWTESNDLFVRFGRRICLPVSPKCSECPFVDACPKIGVLGSR